MMCQAAMVMPMRLSTTRTTKTTPILTQIVYSGDRLPTPVDEERLHHLAHEQCFIANSVKTEIRVGQASELTA